MTPRYTPGRPRLVNWRIGPVAAGLVIAVGALVQCSSEKAPTTGESTAVAASTILPTADGVPSNQTFITVAKLARASVVNISSVREPKEVERPSLPFFDDPFFRRFFGEEFERRFQPPPGRREQGLGSGVIVSADGYIVTNNHVVEQADEIQVLLNDKRKLKARVVGTDPKTDLAVIKVDAQGLPTLPWGDSSTLQVGEMVMAVGNPFGLNQTVTLGIISAVGRANMGIVDYEDFIQTDAAINPGNSGGALVNLKGQLIGINTAIFSRSGGYMGIGFAIPSNMARNVLGHLIDHGKVIRGWLGVSIQELTHDLAEQFDAPDTQGALVADIVDDSPAKRAGFARGDIIIRYDDIPVKNPTHLRTLVAETLPDTSVGITVLREGKEHRLEVRIGEMPKQLAVAREGKPGEITGDHALAGVSVEPYSGGGRDRGVRVSRVEPGSPAERAGLRPGDVIREINRKPVRDVGDFERLAGSLEPKSPVLVLLSRGNATIFLSIRPG